VRRSSRWARISFSLFIGFVLLEPHTGDQLNQPLPVLLVSAYFLMQTAYFHKQLIVLSPDLVNLFLQNRILCRQVRDPLLKFLNLKPGHT
jgi:hypothetical protein